MDIYRGDDLTLQIEGMPSGAKAVEAVVMTDGAAQLKMPVSGNALHIEATELAKLHSEREAQRAEINDLQQRYDL